MKSFDWNKIKTYTDSLDKTNGWMANVLPLEYLLNCGWDKASYDEDATKFNNGALLGTELQVFTLIYTTVLKILAQVEKKSLLINPKTGKSFFNPTMCKILLESYGYVKKALPLGKEIINRKALLQKQQEQTNTSDIDFNQLSKEI